MKTLESLRQSQSARLDQLYAESCEMITMVEGFKEGRISGSLLRGTLAVMRDTANQITQCVHEISAYHNAIHTD